MSTLSELFLLSGAYKEDSVTDLYLGEVFFDRQGFVVGAVHKVFQSSRSVLAKSNLGM